MQTKLSPEMFYKKRVLKNVAKFTGEQLCQIFFLWKLQNGGLKLYQEETSVQVFSCGFAETFKNMHFAII